MIDLKTFRRAGGAYRSQKGITLLEVLVAVVLVGIVGLGISANTVASIQIVEKTMVNYTASNLALSKVEQLAAMNPAHINDTYDQIETGLTVEGTSIKFKRQTDVSVAADGTRVVKVTVSSSGGQLPTQVEFETTFALWE